MLTKSYVRDIDINHVKFERMASSPNALPDSRHSIRSYFFIQVISTR